MAGVKGKAQTSKPSLLSLHLPPAGKEHFLLKLFCPHLLQELYPISLRSYLPLWNFCVNLCFTKLNMVFPTLLLSTLWSVLHLLDYLPAFLCIRARLSLSILTLRSQTHSQWHHFFVYVCWNIPPVTSKNSICLSVPDISVNLQSLRPHRSWSFAAHHLLYYIWGYHKSSDLWPVISKFLFSISFQLFLFSRSISFFRLVLSFSSALLKLPVLCRWAILASGSCFHCQDHPQEEKISSKTVPWETLLVNSLQRVAPHLTIY